MKKFVFGLICGAALSFTTTVFAYDTVQPYLYSEAKFNINGVLIDPGKDNPALNYNDHAYLPIRFISENLGATVGFEDESNTIFIKNGSINITDSESPGISIGNLILTIDGNNTKVIGQMNTNGYRGYLGTNISFYDAQNKKIGEVGVGGWFEGIQTFEASGVGDFRNYTSVRFHIEKS